MRESQRDIRWISEASIDGLCELCGISLESGGGKVAVIGLYLPPGSNFCEFNSLLGEVFTRVKNKFNNVLVVGDLM